MPNQPPAIQTFQMPQMPRIPVRLIAGIAAIILLIVLAWTSCYTVQAESEGVVLRFGKFLKTVEPGLHIKLPLGIDQVTVLPTRRQLKLEFGFVTPGYTNPDQPAKDAGEERSMVTGDLNAALVEWVVQYRIDDPKQYLFDVRNPAQTLRDLSSAAIRAAEGYRFKRVNEAQGDVASFNAMLEQYIKAPEITRTRLYLETLGDVLSATGEKIIIDDSMRNLLPILPLTGKPLEKK